MADGKMNHISDLVCPKCSRVYCTQTRDQFKHHIEICGHGRFTCRVCDASFTTKFALQRHNDIHLNSQKYLCELCSRSFTSKTKLKAHAKSHIDISERKSQRVACELCNQTFQWKSSMRRHLQSHQHNASYVCACKEVFVKYNSFRQHKKKCQIYDDTPNYRDKVKNENDKSLGSHTCQLCQQNFTDRSMLDAHVENCDIDIPRHSVTSSRRSTLNDKCHETRNHGAQRHEPLQTENVESHASSAVELNPGDHVIGNQNHDAHQQSKSLVKENVVRRSNRKVKRKQFTDFTTELPEALYDENKSTVGTSNLGKIRTSKILQQNDASETEEWKEDGTIDQADDNLDTSNEAVDSDNSEYIYTSDGLESEAELTEVSDDEKKPKMDKNMKKLLQKKGHTGNKRTVKSKVTKPKTEQYEDSDEDTDTSTIAIIKCTTNGCAQLCSGAADLRKHKIGKHKEKLQYTCLNCDKLYVRKRTLQEHMSMAHFDRQYTTLCYNNAEFVSPATKKSYMIYMCTRCSFTNTELPFPADHKCIPTAVVYYCPYCKQTFDTSEQVAQHLQREHPNCVNTAQPQHKYGAVKSCRKDPAMYIKDGETSCKTCTASFQTSQDLKKHVNAKHASHPYCCGLCHQSYGRPSALLKHMSSHNHSVCCQVCKKMLTDKQALDRHMAAHTGEKSHQCHTCGKKFYEKKALQRHESKQHQITREKPHGSCVCEQCGKSFAYAQLLKKHLQTHTVETEKILCQYCLQSFTKSKYDTHKCTKEKREKFQKVIAPTDLLGKKFLFQNLIKKESDNSFKCTLCLRGFRTKKSTRNHVKRIHFYDSDKSLVCKICNKGFTRLLAYKIHVRSHSGARPYRCRICHKTYRQLGHVREHLKSHGRLAFPCRLCHLKFKTKQSLSNHVQVHCQVFPYTCMRGDCTRAFKSIDAMLQHFTKDCYCEAAAILCKLCGVSCSHVDEAESHVRKHSADDLCLYQCETCPENFTSFKKLYFHMEDKEHFNRNILQAAADKHEGDDAETGAAEKASKSSEYCGRNFRIEEVELEADYLLSQYDYIAEEDNMECLDTATTHQQDHQQYQSDGSVDEVMQETDNQDMGNETANLVLLAGQLTSISDGTVNHSTTKVIDSSAIDHASVSKPGDIGTVVEAMAICDDLGEPDIESTEGMSVNISADTDTHLYAYPVETTEHQAEIFKGEASYTNDMIENVDGSGNIETVIYGSVDLHNYSATPDEQTVVEVGHVEIFEQTAASMQHSGDDQCQVLEIEQVIDRNYPSPQTGNVVENNEQVYRTNVDNEMPLDMRRPHFEQTNDHAEINVNTAETVCDGGNLIIDNGTEFATTGNGEVNFRATQASTEIVVVESNNDMQTNFQHTVNMQLNNEQNSGNIEIIRLHIDDEADIVKSGSEDVNLEQKVIHGTHYTGRKNDVIQEYKAATDQSEATTSQPGDSHLTVSIKDEECVQEAEPVVMYLPDSTRDFVVNSHSKILLLNEGVLTSMSENTDLCRLQQDGYTIVEVNEELFAESATNVIQEVVTETIDISTVKATETAGLSTVTTQHASQMNSLFMEDKDAQKIGRKRKLNVDNSGQTKRLKPVKKGRQSSSLPSKEQIAYDETSKCDHDAIDNTVELGNNEDSDDNKTTPTFQCLKCHKRFSKLKYLNAHLSEHLPHSLRQHVCSECGMGFNRYQRLQVHMRKHTGERPFMCPHCDKSFKQKGHLQTHVRVHLDDYSVLCKYCDKKFITNSQLKVHVHKYHRLQECKELMLETGTDLLQCKVCNQKFTDEMGLTNHTLEHLSNVQQAEMLSNFSLYSVSMGRKRTRKTCDTASESPYMCSTCGDVMNSKQSLNAHERRHKVKSGQLVGCSLCQKYFSTTAERDQHVDTEHKYKIPCEHCGMQMDNGRLLARHIDKLHKNRDMQCSKCNKVFVSKTGFVNHITVCSGGEFLTRLQEAVK